MYYLFYYFLFTIHETEEKYSFQMSTKGSDSLSGVAEFGRQVVPNTRVNYLPRAVTRNWSNPESNLLIAEPVPASPIQ